MNALVPAEQSKRTKSDPRIEASLAKATEYLSHYKPLAPELKKDDLDGRYQIHLGEPLPKFDTAGAKAYAATDATENRALYGLVCETNAILRHDAINTMLMLRQPDMVSLVAAGAIHLSQPEEERYVIFFERAKGQRLSVMLSEAKGRIPNYVIIEKIIRPLVNAIVKLGETGITHGSINPDNVYYETQAVLGPCVLEPCGFSQPYYYEPLERMEAHPAGKGEFNSGADFYALGVLILEILFGKKHFNRFTQEALCRAILKRGNFEALTDGIEPPEEFYDFLFGMLGSGNERRWNFRYLKPWLDGKHYNVIQGAPPTEGFRPYECFNTTAQSRRELGHLMRHHWKEVPEALSANSLPQWTLMVLRQKEFSELISHHITGIVETGAKNENLRDENILKLILLLDQEGPLQFKQVALHVDGLASYFAHAFLNKNETDIEQLTKFVEQNHASAWLDIQHIKEIDIPEHITNMLTKFDRIRSLLRHSGLGFGMERVLYELNPNMPCLSPLCRGKYITNLTALLKHLDNIAPNFAANQDPIDEHIAAFIASKLGIQTEIKLYDLNASPQIASNRSLIALKLFAIAQHRSGNIELSGLTHWVTRRIMPALEHLHSDTIRGRTLQMLLDEALDGRTQRLGDVILDGEIINADKNGFLKALRNYKHNALRIEHYKRATNLERDGAQIGSIIAQIFSYMALLFSIYNVFVAGM